MLNVNIFLIVLFLLSFFILVKFFLNRRKKFHDTEEEESEEEQHEYEETAHIYEEEKKEEDANEDDRRDIYNKKTPKKKKSGYQTKTYRGTDIEIAEWESAKDLKALKRDDLTTIRTEDLEKEVEKQEWDEKNAPPPPPEIDPDTLKSGVAGEKTAMSAMIQEIKENYRATGKSDALDNFGHSVKGMKKSFEEQNDKVKGSGGRGM